MIKYDNLWVDIHLRRLAEDGNHCKISFNS